MKMWLEALTAMKPTVTNNYHGAIGTQINTNGGAVTITDGKVKLPEGAEVTTGDGQAKLPEGAEVTADDGKVKLPEGSKGRPDVRTMPTYALSEYGRQHEEEAKRCALQAYDKEWGVSSTCALLVWELQHKGYINKTGAAVVRLLAHWEVISVPEEEVKRVADNWGAKLAKLTGKPSEWALSDLEQYAYNSILECFDDE